jgi:hypothetical protein
MSPIRWLAGAVVVAAAALVVYLLLPSDERRVRDRVEALAAALATPPNEPDLARLTRVAGLRHHFTEDAAVYFADEAHQPVHGCDAIVGLIGQSLPMLGPFTVQLDNVRIAIRDDRTVADVHLDGRLVSADGKSEPAVIDARSVGLTLAKVDRAWLVSSVRVMHHDDAMKTP